MPASEASSTRKPRGSASSRVTYSATGSRRGKSGVTTIPRCSTGSPSWKVSSGMAFSFRPSGVRRTSPCPYGSRTFVRSARVRCDSALDARCPRCRRRTTARRGRDRPPARGLGRDDSGHLCREDARPCGGGRRAGRLRAPLARAQGGPAPRRPLPVPRHRALRDQVGLQGLVRAGLAGERALRPRRRRARRGRRRWSSR